MRRVPLLLLFAGLSLLPLDARGQEDLPTEVQGVLEAAVALIEAGRADAPLVVASLGAATLTEDQAAAVGEELLAATEGVQARGEPELALELYRALYAALPAAPASSRARLAAGRLLAGPLRQPAEALPELVAACASAESGERGEVWGELSRCLGALGRKAEALTAALDACWLTPTDELFGEQPSDEPVRQEVARAYLDLAGRPLPASEEAWTAPQRAEALLVAGVVALVEPGDVLDASGQVVGLELRPATLLRELEEVLRARGEERGAEEAAGLRRLHFADETAARRVCGLPALEADELERQLELRELRAGERALAAQARLAAAAGDPQAMLRLAEALGSGEGVLQDPREALEWLRRAADAGEPSAMSLLASYYREGSHGLTRDPVAAARWTVAAARAGGGDLLGYELLGLLERGDPAEVAQVDSSVVPALTRVADEQEDVAAMRVLAALHQRWGSEEDLTRARGWLQRAALVGSPEAQEALAEMFAAGRGGPVDLARAAGWLRVRGLFGDRSQSARDRLSELLAGEPALASAERERARRAAEAGYPSAMVGLAWQLEQGHAAGDEQAAVAWYWRALAGGAGAAAADALSALLRARPELYARELEAARKRAGAGDAEAQHAVGWLLYNGPTLGMDADEPARRAVLAEAVRCHQTEARGERGVPCGDLESLLSEAPTLLVAEVARARASAQELDAWSGFYLGWLLLVDGGEDGEGEGLACLARAAEQGCAPAMLALSDLAESEEAEGLLRRAAEAGEPEGMVRLAELLMDERPEEAEGWWRRAAAAGHPEALGFLAQRLLEGADGGEPDLPAGLEALRRAVRAGYEPDALDRWLLAHPALRSPTDP